MSRNCYKTNTRNWCSQLEVNFSTSQWLVFKSSCLDRVGSLQSHCFGTQPFHECWIGSESVLDIWSSSFLDHLVCFPSFLNKGIKSPKTIFSVFFSMFKPEKIYCYVSVLTVYSEYKYNGTFKAHPQDRWVVSMQYYFCCTNYT